MSLIIVGSIAFDTIETPYGRKEKIVGGSGTYCSLAASFFTQPMIVSVVGEDFPDEIIDLFKKRKIDIQGIEVRSGKTFHWEGRYGDDPGLRLPRSRRTTRSSATYSDLDSRYGKPPRSRAAIRKVLARIANANRKIKT